MPSKKNVPGTSVPANTTPHDQEQLVAQREKTDAAARAGALRSPDSFASKSASSTSLISTLHNLDGYMVMSGFDADHPWRKEIGSALGAPAGIDASIDAVAKEPNAPIPPQDRRNPYFRDANRAASELFDLLKDGLPEAAVSEDDRLRLEAVQEHAENEIRSIADGFSAIGTLVSLTGQVADDTGISGITLIKLGVLIDHLAVTLDAVHELRSDAAFTLSQAARGTA